MDLNVKRPSARHGLALRTALLCDVVEHEVHSNRDACHPRCIPLHGPTRFRVRPGSCDHLSLSLSLSLSLPLSLSHIFCAAQQRGRFASGQNSGAIIAM